MYNNRSGNRQRMNSTDKAEKVRKSRVCGSVWLFVRDCNKIKKSSLVNLVLDLPTLSDPQSLSANQILDSVQDLLDDVRISISEVLATDGIPSSHVAQAAYTRLVLIANQQEILKNRSTHKTVLPTSTSNLHL